MDTTNIKTNLDFLAENIEHLGNPFVVEKLYERERDELIAAETKFAAIKKAHHDFIDTLQKAWQTSRTPQFVDEQYPGKPGEMRRRALPLPTAREVLDKCVADL